MKNYNSKFYIQYKKILIGAQILSMLIVLPETILNFFLLSGKKYLTKFSQ